MASDICLETVGVKYDSKDCPVLYSRIKYTTDLPRVREELLPIIELLKTGSLDW